MATAAPSPPSDPEIARKVTMLRNHGRKDKYLHEKVGFNLRFNEIQAAVGREQLKVLDELNAGRRRAADCVSPRTGRRQRRGAAAGRRSRQDRKRLSHVRHPPGPSHDIREALARHLKEKGIETGVHYPVPNHQQPAITELYGRSPRCPNRGLRQAHPQPADVPDSLTDRTEASEDPGWLTDRHPRRLALVKLR